MGEVWTFLDGECTDDSRNTLCHHLEAYSSCLAHYALEGRIKNLIANGCGGDTADRRLRWAGPMRNGECDEC
jgi:mycothiol system anti-sigma-R factor